jgi:hypothetical protein
MKIFANCISVCKVVLVLCSVAFFVSCGKSSKLSGKKTSNTAAQNKNADDATAENGTKQITNNGAEIQVKSSALLKNSLISCFGSDYTNLDSEMIIKPAVASVANVATGRKSFLLAGKYPNNSDSIINFEAKNLFDPNGISRTATGADGVTDTYLRALEVVADVVAHNCDLNNPYCQCHTEESAKNMIKRCLPYLSPESEEIKTGSKLLFDVCKSSVLEDRRKAISSLVSSYAFAIAR